jgi:hypothetical protein
LIFCPFRLSPRLSLETISWKPLCCFNGDGNISFKENKKNR